MSRVPLVVDDRDRELTAQITDRFERRLGEECSKLRGETGELRTEMREGFANVRTELAELRTEMREGFANVRTETRTEMATFRADMARDRFELLKWAFAFWIGQFFATAALITALARR